MRISLQGEGGGGSQIQNIEKSDQKYLKGTQNIKNFEVTPTVKKLANNVRFFGLLYTVYMRI